MKIFRNLWTSESGQDLVEYSVLLVLVAVGTTAYMLNTGTSASQVWNSTNQTLAAAASPSTTTPPASPASTSPIGIPNPPRDGGSDGSR